MIFEDEAGPLISNTIGQLPSLWRGAKSDSIVDFSRPARNEFLTLIEDNLIAQPYISDVAQSALTLTSSYFLSAISLLMDVQHLHVLRKLDQINTNRDPVESMLGTGASAFQFFGIESGQGLPDPKTSLFGFEATGATFNGTSSDKSVTMNYSGDDDSTKYYHGSKNIQGNDESDTYNHSAKNVHGDDTSNTFNHSAKKYVGRSEDKSTTVGKGGVQNKISGNYNDTKNNNKTTYIEGAKPRDTGGLGFGKDTAVTLKELANLSVGKQFEVVFEQNGNKQSVQVGIRLMVSDASKDVIKPILLMGSVSRSFKERIIRAKAGQLGWFKDLILCNDLIDEARKARIKDKSGFLEHMMRKRSKNWLSGLLSLKPSINNASAILIISADTAKEAELELGGSLSSFPIRQKIFEVTQTMLIFVVDTQWEMVTIYHRGIDRFNEMRVSELKRANSKADGNVEDILRAYSSFTNPKL
jgi:hypothetical protein